MDHENVGEKTKMMLEQLGNVIASLRNKRGWTYDELAARANKSLPENTLLHYEGHTIMLMEAGVEILPEGYVENEEMEITDKEEMNFENALWPVLEVLGVVKLFPLTTKDDIEPNTN